MSIQPNFIKPYQKKLVNREIACQTDMPVIQPYKKIGYQEDCMPDWSAIGLIDFSGHYKDKVIQRLSKTF